MSTSPIVRTPLQLYKHLLRQFGKLPAEPAQFYKFQARQAFENHKDESDPERVQEIVIQAVKDCQWVLAKVSEILHPNFEVSNLQLYFIPPVLH